MSSVIWCDYGNHAAKLDDKVVSMSKTAPVQTVTITDQYGQHVGSTGGTVAKVDICGECAVLLGISNDVEAVEPEKRHAAITNAIKGGTK